MYKFIKYYIVTILVILTSCSEYSLDFNPLILNYLEGFSSKYGLIDSTHTWGFDNITRAINPNSNQWESDYGLTVPLNVTEEEANYVTNWFQTHQNPLGLNISWSEFFVLHVYHSGLNMDLLITLHTDGTEEHINNFNKSGGTIEYHYDAGTANWSYWESNNSSRLWNHYNIQHLTFLVNGHSYDGYYIGFDYNSVGLNASVYADGVYADWIIKVTPGLYSPCDRIMCEDLGDTFDFDFNDLVFDIYQYDSNTEVIIVKACAGTLPIYINDEEVHSMFEVDTDIPVNAGPLTVLRPEVIYRIKSSSPSNIKITVNNLDFIVLTASKGKAPLKILVPNTVQWTNELLNIEDKYVKFEQWVQDSNIKFWE